jgi:hypothetical protein
VQRTPRRRFAPATREIRSAEALVEPLLARVREGIRNWKATKQVPPEIEVSFPGAAKAAAQPTLAGLEAELGPGQRVDPATASSMSSLVGGDVSAARIHTGAEAARLAADADASAFTVGNNVVFGDNAFQPGTVHGDALLARNRSGVQKPGSSRSVVSS